MHILVSMASNRHIPMLLREIVEVRGEEDVCSVVVVANGIGQEVEAGL